MTDRVRVRSLRNCWSSDCWMPYTRCRREGREIDSKIQQELNICRQDLHVSCCYLYCTYLYLLLSKFNLVLYRQSGAHFFHLVPIGSHWWNTWKGTMSWRPQAFCFFSQQSSLRHNDMTVDFGLTAYNISMGRSLKSIQKSHFLRVLTAEYAELSQPTLVAGSFISLVTAWIRSCSRSRGWS